MDKLAEILHELIDAMQHVLTPGRRAELHALADDAVAVLPEPEKAAVEVAVDVAEAADKAAKGTNGTPAA